MVRDSKFGVHVIFERKVDQVRDIYHLHLGGGDVTKHYYADGQRIASRGDDDVR